MAGPDFGKQIGPLPLGAWVVLVAGGLGVAVWSAQNQKTVVDVPVRDTSGDPGVGMGGGGWVQVQPQQAQEVEAAKITTNEQWAVSAINFLILTGANPITADTAVRNYLESKSLTFAQQALIAAALAKFGSPPYPLPEAPEETTLPPPVTTPPPPVVVIPPPPPPAPPPVPAALRIHVVRKDETLSHIAQMYYGAASRWPQIYAANRGGTIRPDGSPGFIYNPHYLRVGDRVYVP